MLKEVRQRVCDMLAQLRSQALSAAKQLFSTELDHDYTNDQLSY